MPRRKLGKRFNPRSRRGQVTPEMATRPPSPQSIQRLNLNIRKLEQLGRELNFPVSVLLASGARLVITYPLKPYMPQLIRYINAAVKKLGALIVMPLAVSGIYKVAYHVYQPIVSAVQRFFPNGIGFTRKQYSYEYTQKQCLTRNQVIRINREMEALIAKQMSRKNKQLYLSMFVSAVLPFLLTATLDERSFSIGHGGKPALMMTIFGPYLGFSLERPTALSNFISGFSGSLQGLTVFKKVYGWYANYNLPKQLISFKQKLNRLGALQAGRWQKISKNEKTRDEAMFLLDLDVDVDNKSWVKIDRGTKDHRWINVSKQNYLIALHECLESIKAPVFVDAYNNSYLGFMHLSDKMVEQCREKLQYRLERINQLETQAKERINQLNYLLLHANSDNVWDYRTDVRRGKLNVTFFSDVPRLAPHKKSAVLEQLEVLVGEQNIKSRGKRIILKNIHAISNQALNESIVAVKNAVKQKPVIQVVTSVPKKALINTVTIAKPPKTQRAPKPVETPEPAVVTKDITFSEGFRFFKREAGQKTDRRYAYPISVPWRKAGTCFASLTPEMFDYMKPYLNETKMLAPLERGKVFTQRSTQKNKTGTVGIQVDATIYKDINGEKQTAELKLKYSNNIRIFGHKVETKETDDGNKYTLYQFDGAGYGH